MMYWDNAATTWPKPPCVLKAVGQALRYGANPGRAGHEMAIKTAEMVYDCRERVADFFGLSDPAGVVFTPNCTASVNTVIRGLLDGGGRVLTSDLEHNAVMRPLHALGRYDTANWSADEDETVENFRRALRPDTKLIICTHCSNVFGVTFPIRKLAMLAHRYGVVFCVDAAQSAGVLPIDMDADDIDYLCVAPHKGLYAPTGTGLLLCRERKGIEPLVRGGTGSQSLQLEQPLELPERLESGTVNVPGIAGIAAGIQFVNQMGRDHIYQHEMLCLNRVYTKLKRCEAITLYTPEFGIGTMGSLMSLNIQGYSSEEVGSILSKAGVAVRAGWHCAGAAHRRFGTVNGGTVRLAPSAFTSIEEADKISKLFLQIAEKRLH